MKEKIERKNLEIKAFVKIKKLLKTEHDAIMYEYKTAMTNFSEKMALYREKGLLSKNSLEKVMKGIDIKKIEKMDIQEPQIITATQPQQQQQHPPQQQQQHPPQQQQQYPPQQQQQYPPQQQQQYPPQQQQQYPPQQQQQYPPQQQQQYPPQQQQPPSSDEFRIKLPQTTDTQPVFQAPPPQQESKQDFSFTIPKQLSTPSTQTPTPSTSSSILDEEDRATGIAILRRKMLQELKKIREVVAEEDEFGT